MTKKDRKYFFEKARYLSLEDYKRCTTFKLTDCFDDCSDKLFNVVRCFNHHERDAWNFLEAIYKDLPIQHRIPLMLGVVYQSYNVDYPRMAEYIDDYICGETPELEEQRIARNKKLLEKHINADGTITLYRGIAEGRLLPELAVSYTVDKAVAESFVEHHKARHHSRFGGIYSRIVNFEDVLFYSNEREEQEVFIIPDDVSFLPLLDENDIAMVGTLGILSFQKLFPEKYAKFVSEHGVEREPEFGSVHISGAVI